MTYYNAFSAHYWATKCQILLIKENFYYQKLKMKVAQAKSSIYWDTDSTLQTSEPISLPTTITGAPALDVLCEGLNQHGNTATLRMTKNWRGESVASDLAVDRFGLLTLMMKKERLQIYFYVTIAITYSWYHSPPIVSLSKI